MRVGDDLTIKALLALEEALHDCRYRHVQRSRALRLALVYLLSIERGDTRAFVDFWREVACDNAVLRFGVADRALDRIHAAVGRKRDESLSHAIWEEVQNRILPHLRGGRRCSEN